MWTHLARRDFPSTKTRLLTIKAKVIVQLILKAGFLSQCIHILHKAIITACKSCTRRLVFSRPNWQLCCKMNLPQVQSPIRLVKKSSSTKMHFFCLSLGSDKNSQQFVEPSISFGWTSCLFFVFQSTTLNALHTKLRNCLWKKLLHKQQATLLFALSVPVFGLPLVMSVHEVLQAQVGWR